MKTNVSVNLAGVQSKYRLVFGRVLLKPFDTDVKGKEFSMRQQPITSGVDSRHVHKNWEYLVMTVAPNESLPQARQRLVEHAEYGQWELQRSVLYRGGKRRFWLRRRFVKVYSTL